MWLLMTAAPRLFGVDFNVDSGAVALGRGGVDDGPVAPGCASVASAGDMVLVLAR
jgi:hypothetical protein